MSLKKALSVVEIFPRLLVVLLFLHDKGVASAACNSPPCLFYTSGTSITSVEITSFKKTLVVRNLVNATAVDVHIKHNLLFWTENSARVIRRVNLSSGKIEEVITKRLGEVGGLSVEWESGLLYWTDVMKKRVEVARLDGSSRKILFDEGVAQPRAIAVDPRKGYMFWTVEGAQARIERSYLSGEKRTTIVRLARSHQHWPNQIIIDFEEERIYWLDAFWDTIESVDYYGEYREREKTRQGVINPLGLTILNNVLYWTDSKGPKVQERLSEIDSLNAGDHAMDNGGMGGLALIDQSRQPVGKAVCRNQGPCSDLCLLTPSGYRCACPTGVDLQEDGETCEEKDLVNDLLLVTSFGKRKIYQVTFDEDEPRSSPLNLKHTREPMALAFDPEDEMMYWTDIKLKRISRAFLDGEDEEVIINSKLLSPKGLAVDSLARNLYWTDYEAGRIEVSHLDGSNRKVLIFKNLENPLDIVLDTKRRIMYWLSAGEHPAIERANMDGSDRQIVTYFPKSLASHVPSPHGLALDFAENKLYCNDQNLARLQFIDLHSAHPKFVTLVSHADYMRRPYGTAVDTSYVYWTDTTREALYRANKTTGEGVERLAFVEAPRDVLVYYKSEISTDDNACAQDNGGCTHLCLLRPTGHHCACPTDLPDGDSCLESPTTTSAPETSPSTNVTPSPSPSAISKEESKEENFGTSEPVLDNSGVSPSDRNKEVETPSVRTNTSCDGTTCLNGGWCSETGTSGEGPCFCEPDYALGHCELFIGAEKIKMTFEMRNDEWNKKLFQETLSEVLTEYCAGDTTTCYLNKSPETSLQAPPSTISDQSVDDIIFTPNDVLVPQRPDEVSDSMLEVEAAVLRPLRYSTEAPELVSRRVLCQIVKFSADRIRERLGDHRLAYINGRKDPSCDEEIIAGEASHSRNQDKALISTLTGGVIGAIAVVVILATIIIITAVAIFVGCKKGGFRQTTILPKFIRNPKYEYKMLTQGRKTNHTSKYSSPTYEEVIPNLLTSAQKTAKEENLLANNPLRSVQNVYSEPLSKPTPCTPHVREQSDLDENSNDAATDNEKDHAEDDGTDAANGADSAESPAIREEESNSKASNDDPDKAEMDPEGLEEEE